MKGNKRKQSKPKQCGPCNMCCIVLKIDDNKLKKEADTPCKHLSPEKGCSIYADRPETCRNWLCAWMAIPGLPNTLRPDKCGFVIRPSDSPFEYTLTASENHTQALTSTAALEFIATCIRSNFVISVNVPTKPGHVNAKTMLTGFVREEDLRSEQSLRIKVLSAMVSGANANTDLIVKIS